MDDEKREVYSVKQIRKAFAKHAGTDDWGVKAFYENSLISSLRGEFDKKGK
jgi:hypothetical protein